MSGLKAEGQIAVVVVDATAASHVPGAEVEHFVRLFPMPAGMAEYIRLMGPSCGSVNLAIVDEAQP